MADRPDPAFLRISTSRVVPFLILVASLVLSACGGGASSSNTGTTASTPAASTPPPPPPTPTTYTLTVTRNGTGTVTSSPSGINCGSDCSEPYNSGTQVTLTAAAGAGYTFTGWSGSGISCSGTGSCTVTMSAARTVTATFSPTQASNYTLLVNLTGTGTVTSSPAGITCGTDCSESYTSGTSVTLTAAAGSGYTFGGWGGSCTGSATTCTTSMTQARTVYATFNANSATLPLTSIRLIPVAASTTNSELVSLGIPFPPDTLTNAANVRVLDENGNEVPAYVTPKVYWHFKPNASAIRSVLVQFRVDMSARTERRFSFATNQARQLNLAAQTYADGLMVGKSSADIPRILPVLTAEWLSSSLVAGPQVTKALNTAYPDYETWFETFYSAARNYSYTDDYANWLFDRATTIYKQYVRTGNPAYLQEAYNSTTFYRTTLDTSGSCIGSLRMTGKNCDSKYNYTEPLALHYMLTGDDRFIPTIQNVARGWSDSSMWTYFDPRYVRGSGFWTERHAGFGWLAAIHAYEILGGQSYRDRVDYYANTLFTHLNNPPDNLGKDGCWRHDSYDHDQYEFFSNFGGCSPWMVTIILDGMWKYWNITADARVGDAARSFATFMENYGWRPNGNFAMTSSTISSYYYASSTVPVSVYAANTDNDWYTDLHNLELIFAYSLAYAFDSNSANRQTYLNRISRIRHVFTYGAQSTQRSFNWAFRGTSPFLHLLQQP